MKKTLVKISALCTSLMVLAGCAKYDEKWAYEGGVVSPYIAIYDIRTTYKNEPVELNTNSLFGSSRVSAVVISDHREGNIPEGILVVQNNPRLGFLRGLAFDIGPAAATYFPGDSVHIDLVGGLLDKQDGMLVVKNVGAEKIEKIASDRPINVLSVNSNLIIDRPGDYENTLVEIVKGGFIPAAEPGQLLSGDHQITDGYGIVTLKVEPTASFASNEKFPMANYVGIINTRMIGDSAAPVIRPRGTADIRQFNSVFAVPKIIITGWHNDPKGGDANYEYMQFMATEDIDFSVTPYSVVTCNNAGGSTPGGPVVNGWATGGTRSYKFNLTSGFAEKGSLFYVGGTGKAIDASGSTSIASANWISARAYNEATGEGFGAITTNLLANSGNAYGVAVFAGTTVDKNSIPMDVMFVGTGGTTSIWDPSINAGYRIANSDFYDILNPRNFSSQPFYRAGSNLTAMGYSTPTDAGLYNSWSGEYNLTLRRWTKARTKVIVQVLDNSPIDVIENPDNIVKLVE